MNMKKNLNLIFTLLLLSSCSLSPGMYMNTESTWGGDESVYIASLDQNIPVVDIKNAKNVNDQQYRYEIGVGDQIAVTVWGLPEIFPVVNVNREQNLRRVDLNGNIFFPYAGLVKAKGKTQDQLRNDLTSLLSSSFNDPQIDISIAQFNSQQVFVLGEVTKPIKLSLSDVPISLADALGEAYGLNTNTAAASQVFVIRQSASGKYPQLFHADMQNPSYFIDAGKFYLEDNDIVYVNASGTARWNRVISQFFPFSTFLNSVDNLVND